MSNTTTREYNILHHRAHRANWLIVPVMDDEDGSVTCWDVHRDEQDWSSAEPVASGTTQREAIDALRLEVWQARELRAFTNGLTERN
jgi:hypothetical protein